MSLGNTEPSSTIALPSLYKCLGEQNGSVQPILIGPTPTNNQLKVGIPTKSLSTSCQSLATVISPLTFVETRGRVVSTNISSSVCEEKTVEYLRDLINEKLVWDEATRIPPCGSRCITLKLIEQEISRIQSGGKPPGRDSKFVDIYHEKPIRLTVRALVPVKEHPKFNFVGKLLGPKGNSMKRLQEDTLTKMAVLGRGSMRNKQQEEDFRISNDPKYSHLKEDLHVEITAFAPPSEAHARIAYALTEVRKYLIPDSNDEIRQKQMREMKLLNTQTGSRDSGEEQESVGEGLSPPPRASDRQKMASTLSSTPMLVVKGMLQPQHLNPRTCKLMMSTNNSRQGGGGHGNPEIRFNSHKVLSILDRMRQGRTSPRCLHPKAPISAAFSEISPDTSHKVSPSYMADTMNMVEDSRRSYEDLEHGDVLYGKSVKTSAHNRSRVRMLLSPYTRPT